MTYRRGETVGYFCAALADSGQSRRPFKCMTASCVVAGQPLMLYETAVLRCHPSWAFRPVVPFVSPQLVLAISA
jgi:hypothetical protein